MSVDSEHNSPLTAPRKRRSGGLPAYMATFADLMSLLLCFFVLLLSMSQLDKVKYKMVIHSLSDAFGVQPSASQLQLHNIQRQPSSSAAVIQPEITRFNNSDKDHQRQTETISDWLRRQKRALRQLLQPQIDKQQISVDTVNGHIVIRIHENASFPSGSAKLKNGILPVLDEISNALLKIQGRVVVAGYTDNQPLKAGRYHSNWELSAARAGSVLYELLRNKHLNANRFHIEGYAETQPLTDNLTPAHRALNRRVEISIIPPLPAT